MAKAGAVWLDVLPSMRGFTRELRSGSAGAARIVGTETGRQMGNHMVAESVGQFGRRFGGDIRREVARQEPAMRTAFRRAGSGAGQAGADAGRQMANHMVAESTTQFGRRFGGDIQQEMRRQEPALRTAFRRAADPAGQAGGEAGQEFAQEFTRDAAGRLRDAKGRFAAAGQGAGEGFGSGVEGGGSGRLSGLSGKWSGAMAKAGPWVAAGAVIGGAVLKGVTEAMDKQDTLARFRSQIGQFGPEGERLGKIAGQLYADAYGDSLGDVTEALRGVRTNIAGMSTASAEDIKTVTGQVIRLGEVFDEDVGQTSRAVGKMIKTGLAKDATEALDILTAGFQSGANEADDLLDTFSEYSTQFRNMGLSGEQAMGIISQGLRAGARDADVVADAIKEFSIEAVAGSDKIRDAYGELGLNADKMFAALGKGGPEAAKALDITLDKLREVEDPVERNALAVELFGTKAEDLGDALYALDPSEAVKSLGNVAGAAKRVSDEMGETASARLERFKRGIKSAFVETVGGTVLGNLEKLASRLSGVPKWAQQAGDRLRSAFSGGGGPGRINQLANSFGGLGEKLRGLGGTGLQQLEKIGGKLGKLFSSIGETVGEFRTKHADRLSNTFDKVSDATRGFSDALGSVADFGGIVLERVGGKISLFIDSVQKIWDLFGGQILDGITSHFDGVIGTIEGAFKTIQGIFQIATGILSGDWGKAWDGIKNVATGAFKFLTSMPRAMLGFLARTVWNLLTKIGGFFKSVFVGIKDGTVRRLREMRDGAMARLQSMRDGAVRRLQAMRDGAVNRIQNMRNAVTSRVQSMRDAVVVRITSLRDRAEAAVQRMRNNIVDRAQNLRDRVTSTIASLRDRVVQSFRNAASGIRTAWSKIEGYTRKPIRFVIQTVYNEGIRGVWNKIADKVPVIPSLGAMPLPRGFQRGGVVDMRGGGVQPGFSRKDNRLAMFRDGEGVLVPEAVRSLGANFVHMANRLGDRAGALLTGGKLPGFQFGG
ncbi:MAG TPA: phage tail tape measure protein, partial [Vulgatibacteraceae bacterium]|nr:phage tail tape measure protein [Vulgatibacteraceae bacterium]